jgi:hypothetical protein
VVLAGPGWDKGARSALALSPSPIHVVEEEVRREEVDIDDEGTRHTP